MLSLIQKMIMTLFLSLLFVFSPFVNTVLILPSSIANNEVQIVQQVESVSSYSSCNAATNNKSWSKNKTKKPVKEASFLSKAAGFGIGLVVCAFMMGLAAVISMSVFHNDFDIASGEGPWVKHGLLTGVLYFIGRCIATGLVANIFDVSANMIGFIRWFDYASYAIILYLFLKDKYRNSFCMSIVGGYILGYLLMEMLFGR